MKKIIYSIISLILLNMISVAFAKNQVSMSNKVFPEVTFDKVQKIFGHNLDTDDTRLKTFLLAIGMDHTSPNSPHSKQQIGIPYIVDKGPGYWVSRFRSGERKLDVVVNNALLLLFSKEEIPNSEKVAFSLLQIASDEGYWPADYFVAETNLVEHLTVNHSIFVLRDKYMQPNKSAIAQDTMSRYNRCAEMEFAPCQYRIGFWLSASPKSQENGLKVLKHAVVITMNDKRYRGVLDGALLMAKQLLEKKGSEI